MELLSGIDPALFCPRAALDIGAGSGILSFAIARQFECPVIAADIEKQAVATIARNAAANGLDGRITALQADGFDHPEIAARGPYDLIVMNILAEPLLRLAVEAERHLAVEGMLILSGILQWQELQIREAYISLGLELRMRLVIADWVVLGWQKPDEETE